MLFCYINILLKIIRVKFAHTDIKKRAINKIGSYLIHLMIGSARSYHILKRFSSSKFFLNENLAS